jgi:hypothetical protein
MWLQAVVKKKLAIDEWLAAVRSGTLFTCCAGTKVQILMLLLLLLLLLLQAPH